MGNLFYAMSEGFALILACKCMRLHESFFVISNILQARVLSLLSRWYNSCQQSDERLKKLVQLMDEPRRLLYRDKKFENLVLFRLCLAKEVEWKISKLYILLVNPCYCYIFYLLILAIVCERLKSSFFL